MGLLAREIEQVRIATVSFSLNREQSQAVQAPRSIVVRFPFGHPLGEPHATRQQHQLLFDAFHLALTATNPGTILERPYRWKRHQYGEVNFSSLSEIDLELDTG